VTSASGSVASSASGDGVSFNMPAGDTTAVATYIAACTLTVQSSGVAGMGVTASNSAYSGITNYSKLIPQGTSLTLSVPATDPNGYVFVHWTLNGVATPLGTDRGALRSG